MINWALLITIGILETMFVIGFVITLRSIYFLKNNQDPKEALKTHFYFKNQAIKKQREALDKLG